MVPSSSSSAAPGGGAPSIWYGNPCSASWRPSRYPSWSMMRVAPHGSPVRCSEDGHVGSARQASVDPSDHAPSSLSVGPGVAVESLGIVVVDSLTEVVESPVTDVVVAGSLVTDVVVAGSGHGCGRVVASRLGGRDR